MNLVGLIFGSGKKAKLSRRGMEKAWNMTAEPLQRFLQYPYKNRKHRAQYLKKKHSYCA